MTDIKPKAREGNQAIARVCQSLIDGGSMNKTQLSGALGICRGTLNRRIDGSAEFSLFEVCRLCDLLGVSISELLKRGREMQSTRVDASS